MKASQFELLTLNVYSCVRIPLASRLHRFPPFGNVSVRWSRWMRALKGQVSCPVISM